jgi:hypothetical protein
MYYTNHQSWQHPNKTAPGLVALRECKPLEQANKTCSYHTYSKHAEDVGNNDLHASAQTYGNANAIE